MKIKMVAALRLLRLACRISVEVIPMTAHDVAHYFVSLVDEEEGDSISNLKLQKLLYYAQGFHLAFFDRPLFTESIKAWKHGPAVPQVYHEYKDFGANPIPVTKVNLDDYPQETREFLDEVYSVYGQFTAPKLLQLTHSEPPWKDTPQSETISHESMRTFFKTLLVADDDSETKTQ
jgi:uncharacterized phage-associated protein